LVALVLIVASDAVASLVEHRAPRRERVMTVHLPQLVTVAQLLASWEIVAHAGNLGGGKAVS
jgi:hypothetical protein